MRGEKTSKHFKKIILFRKVVRARNQRDCRERLLADDPTFLKLCSIPSVVTFVNNCSKIARCSNDLKKVVSVDAIARKEY